MSAAQKRWQLKPVDEKLLSELSQQLNIHPMLLRLLVQRGVHTYEEAKNFFRPELSHLHDPFLMKDMQVAINRISKAIEQGEKILVYGDYDVDGTTAVATVYSFFKKFYPHIDYYIPNRYSEGYGISFQGIDFAEANNFPLIIALDCGIKSVDKVEYANGKHIDFIICDHHLPGEEIPKAVAVLDPKRNDCTYPYKELSGCGIGFKLIQAYSQQHGFPLEEVYTYLDLVCTSIGADIVPITGENRVLAFHGLKKINTHPSAGIKSLMEVAAVKKEMDITDVVFILAPRINAAGRMDDAKHAVKLLIAEELPAVKESARMLQDFNTDRTDLDKAITQHALQLIAADEVLVNKKSTVLYDSNWHKGVLGIVASRLTDTYYRPTIIMTESDGKLTGSARSVKGFDLYEAIYECRDLLIQFGGHRAAAGLTMHKDNFAAFAEKFEAVVSQRILPEQLIPEIEIDAVLQPSDITPAFFNIIKQLAPFGPENMKPTFMSRQLSDTGYSRVLKDEHLKLHLCDDSGLVVDGIAFGMAGKQALLNGPVDVAYHIEENTWNNQTKLQWMVKDIRSATEN